MSRDEVAEAKQWLTTNPNRYCFAGNRFDDADDILKLVTDLYDHGAAEVQISNIHDEEWRIKKRRRSLR
jgi:hypothetical protein